MPPPPQKKKFSKEPNSSCYFVYQIGSFSKTQHAEAGQQKVNNNKISIKLSDVFDQNPPHTLGKIVKKHTELENALKA